MREQPLFWRFERCALSGGFWALAIVAVLRRLAWPLLAGLWRTGFSWPPRLVHWHWFTGSQIIATCLVLSALLIGGLLLPRRFWRLSAVVLGGSGWLFALMLLPEAATGEVLGIQLWSGDAVWPPLLWVSGAVLLVSSAVRVMFRRRWLATLSGHGHNWILNWARDRSYGARLLARRVLANLGYYP